ncbi:hypothetical protein M569_16966 [Genlisea aurea]|uniref:Transcription repressor n=1 Tax=Genlisea aurea TaxID=192259 RepID=S8C0D6_9LAMI|nr:hypothetical protein M569_16966 [Genlisea aurea]
MPTGKKWTCRKILTAGVCGCASRKPEFLQPQTKPTVTNNPLASPSSKSLSKIFDSRAVVKDSDDPYRDFRDSMIRMITEREIYTEDGLRRLLRCFLELNPPHHHGVIVKAFAAAAATAAM